MYSMMWETENKKKKRRRKENGEESTFPRLQQGKEFGNVINSQLCMPCILHSL